jgi:LAO/AO transport system kinase
MIISIENDKIKQTCSEKAGISQPEIFSPSAVRNIQNTEKQPSSEELVHAILLGNITALSRAITLVESIQLI